MADRYACAAFYLPASDVDPGTWAEQLLGKLDVRVWTDPYGERLTTWGRRTCRVEVVEAPPYRVLAMVFPQTSLAALLRDNSSEVAGDNARELAYAFRDACQAFEPVAGFVAAQPVPDLDALTELLTDHADDLAHHDLLSLTGAGHGLVYVRDPGPALDATLRTPRDELEVATGRLLFAGKGPNRWWG